MRKLAILCICLSLFQSVSAQAVKEAEKPNVVSKGKNVVNLYYGYSFFGSLLKTYSSQADYKSSSLGPIGLVYEHLMTDDVGLGVELGYQQINWSYKYNGSYFNASSQNVPYTETYTWKYTLMRIQFRFNYHFTKSEKFDAYFLTSIGYRDAKYNWSYTTTDPNSNGVSSSNLTTPKSPIIFGVKPGLGFRYFLTNSIGLNLEIAAGTPLMCGGLSFKF